MARSYSTINAKLWAGRTGIKLRQNVNARVVQVYLLSCSAANAIGLYHIAIPTIAHETGLEPDQVRDGLLFLRDHCGRFCDYDEDVELVWIPRMALFQIGERMAPRDKFRASVLRSALDHAGHRFFDEFVETYAEPFGLRELRRNTEGLPEITEGASATQEGASANQEGTGRVGSGRVYPEKNKKGAPDSVQNPEPTAIAPGITNHTPVTVAAGKLVPIPPDFAPEPRHAGVADLHGLDLAAQVADFVAHARDNARTSADWSAAFDRWLNKAAGMAQNQRRTGNTSRGYGSRPPEQTPEEQQREAELRRARTVIDCDRCGGIHLRGQTGNGIECRPKEAAA